MSEIKGSISDVNYRRKSLRKIFRSIEKRCEMNTLYMSPGDYTNRKVPELHEIHKSVSNLNKYLNSDEVLNQIDTRIGLHIQLLKNIYNEIWTIQKWKVLEKRRLLEKHGR